MNRILVSFGILLAISTLVVMTIFPNEGGRSNPDEFAPENFVIDGGFEGTVVGSVPANVNWPSTSTNFGTSLCSVAYCGDSADSAPRTGAYYAWFGGINAAEVGTVQQTVVIPAGSSPVLKYWLRINAVSAPFTSTMDVKVDGVIVRTHSEPATRETAYTERTVVLPVSFANGAPHVISFTYNNPAAGGVSNFILDDVTIEAGAGVVTPSPTPSATPTTNVTISYTGPAVAIPDDLASGTNVALPVNGLTGVIGDLNLRFDGASSANPTATTVGVNHSWIGDLKFTLTSPSGTSVTVIDLPGVPASASGCDSNNFAALTLDDEGGFLPVENQCGANGDAPFPSGVFAPNSPLSAFDGQSPNGIWTLNVSDNAGQDVGSLRAFSLVFGLVAPTPASVTGRVLTPDGRGLRNAIVTLASPLGLTRTSTTSSFGVYTFEGVTTGQTYVLGVISNRYRFASRNLTVNGNLVGVDVVGVD